MNNLAERPNDSVESNDANSLMRRDNAHFQTRWWLMLHFQLNKSAHHAATFSCARLFRWTVPPLNTCISVGSNVPKIFAFSYDFSIKSWNLLLIARIAAVWLQPIFQIFWNLPSFSGWKEIIACQISGITPPKNYWSWIGKFLMCLC